MKRIAFASLLPLVLASAACGNRSLAIHRPKSPVVNQAVTAMWRRDIQRVARTGDWILTRSYSFTGDVIVATTRGEALSHASIYDARTGTIIEALSPEVREVPLDSLLDRNQHAIIVRPVGLTAAQRVAAGDRAREQVGTEFDFGGLFGVDSEERFYCSELVYWASGLDPARRPRVVTPADLMAYGEVVYFSGKRDDQEIQSAALASLELDRRRALALTTRVARRGR